MNLLKVSKFFSHFCYCLFFVGVRLLTHVLYRQSVNRRGGGSGPSGGGGSADDPMQGGPQKGGQWSGSGPWTDSSVNLEKMVGDFFYLCAVTQTKYDAFKLLGKQLIKIEERIWDGNIHKTYSDNFQNYTQTKMLMEYVHEKYNWQTDRIQRLQIVMDCILALTTTTIRLENWINYLKAFSGDERAMVSLNALDIKLKRDLEKEEITEANVVVPAAAVNSSADAVSTTQDPALISRLVDSSDEDKDGGGAAPRKRPLDGEGSTNIPDSPISRQRTDTDDTMFDAQALGGAKTMFPAYTGADYDVDYIATRLDRLRDW